MAVTKRIETSAGPIIVRTDASIPRGVFRIEPISPATLALWKRPRKYLVSPPLTKARLLAGLARGPKERIAYSEGFEDCRASPGLWWRLVDWWRARR